MRGAYESQASRKSHFTPPEDDCPEPARNLDFRQVHKSTDFEEGYFGQAEEPKDPTFFRVRRRKAHRSVKPEKPLVNPGSVRKLFN
jgi:hypothetical protein